MGQLDIAEVGHVEVHRRGMAVLIKTMTRRSLRIGELKANPSVVRRSSNFGMRPVTAKMLDPHLGVRLETTTGQHDCVGQHLLAIFEHDPRNPAIVNNQISNRCRVPDVAAQLFDNGKFAVNQTRAFASSRKREASPEHLDTVSLERLPVIDRLETNPLVGEPLHGRQGFVDEGPLLHRQFEAFVEAV